MKRIQFLWHKFWFDYNHILLGSCQEENERGRILDKMNYHEAKAIRIIHHI